MLIVRKHELLKILVAVHHDISLSYVAFNLSIFFLLSAVSESVPAAHLVKLLLEVLHAHKHDIIVAILATNVLIELLF